MGSGMITAALESAGARFVAVALGAPDPTAPVPATPAWSVSDVVGHVSVEIDRYARELEGRGDWSATATDIAGTNAAALRALDTADIGELTGRIERRLRDYVRHLRERELDARTHGLDAGLVLTPRQAAGVLLGELAIHGRDVARATGQRAPLGGDAASLILEGVFATMPAMFNRERAGRISTSVEMRFRGGVRHRVTVHNGALEVDGPRPQRVDAVIAAWPAPFVLTAYGRVGKLRSVLTGGAFVWGRRPDRALVLDRLFHSI